MGSAAHRWWVPYAFLVPGLAFFGVFFAWPALIAVQMSFFHYDVVTPPRWVGLANFHELVTNEEFWQAFWNSVEFLALFLPLVMVVPLLLAMAVNARLRGIRVFRLIYYLPVITSMVAIAIAWAFVFHPRGVLNWMLVELGLVDEPIQFLLDPTWALPAVVVVEAWQAAGYFMMIYLAGLQSIPHELHEAAQLDGAGWWRRFANVTVPLIRPYAAVCLVLGGIMAMQSFASIYVMTRGGPQGATTTLGFYIWSEAFEHFDFGYASAVGLVLWAILVVFALGNYRLTRGEPVG
jgi:putative chitobiose transport system permease protein